MPSNFNDQTIHIGTRATIELMNEAALPRPGELGKRTIIAGKEYQVVKLDSGATASNTVGVVAAGQLAFWKSKTSYIVTNDIRQALGASTGCRNNVAGVFTTTLTAGQFGVVQQRGNKTGVSLKSASPNVGDWIVADNTANTAQADVVAIATAPTVQPIGKASASGSSVTTIAVDLDIPQVP